MVSRVNPLLSYLVGGVLGALVYTSYLEGDDISVLLNGGFGVLVLALIVYGELQDGAFADVDY